MRKPSARFLALALAVLLLAIPTQALIGALPVIDVSNLAQNILQVIHAVDQIRQQIAQLETMYRNLEIITDPNWRDLRDQFLLFNELTRQGSALSYAEANAFARFRTLLPGFARVEVGEFEEVYATWTEVGLDTLAATLESASAQAEEYLETQDQLIELQAIANSADGNLEVLNASNMLQGHIAQETTKLNQLLAASMNAQNVYFGTRLNFEASQEATQRWLITAARGRFHVYTGSGGFTGIPDNWPYRCFGCPRSGS